MTVKKTSIAIEPEILEELRQVSIERQIQGGRASVSGVVRDFVREALDRRPASGPSARRPGKKAKVNLGDAA